MNTALTTPCKSLHRQRMSLSQIFSGHSQFTESQTTFITRDFHGRITIHDVLPRKPWFHARAHLKAYSEEGKDYRLPLQILPSNTLAAATVKGYVTLFSLEDHGKTAKLRGIIESWTHMSNPC